MSINHEKYTLVIVDEYSRYTWVHSLRKKSQTAEMIMSFIRMVENQNDVKVKQIRTDNGIEFRNSKIESFFYEKGISHNFSSLYTPKQNGLPLILRIDQSLSKDMIRLSMRYSEKVKEDLALNKKVLKVAEAYTKNSTNLTELLTLVKNFDFPGLKTTVDSLQADVTTQNDHLAKWAEMTEILCAFKGQSFSIPSSSVLNPTLAIIGFHETIKGGVFSSHCYLIPIEETPSHTKGENAVMKTKKVVSKTADAEKELEQEP
nr:retrovirus-related Pol polyprotein from transposon TNT 1-94 [Tanacetum cinerariifolium]